MGGTGTGRWRVVMLTGLDMLLAGAGLVGYALVFVEGAYPLVPIRREADGAGDALTAFLGVVAGAALGTVARVCARAPACLRFPVTACCWC